jgi:hypothetical protein
VVSTSAALLALLASAAPAPAGELVELELGAREGRLVVRLDLRPAFPEELRRTFGNCLKNSVAMQVALLPRGGEDPAALVVRTVELRRDPWDETFGVVVRDPATPGGRLLTVRTFEELREILGDARDLDLGPLSELGGGTWFVQVRIDVNPVSPELLERTREFLASPPSGVRGSGTPSRSVLGAMARALLSGGEATEARHLHTRTFTAREVPSR